MLELDLTYVKLQSLAIRPENAEGWLSISDIYDLFEDLIRDLLTQTVHEQLAWAVSELSERYPTVAIGHIYVIADALLNWANEVHAILRKAFPIHPRDMAFESVNCRSWDFDPYNSVTVGIELIHKERCL